MTHTESNFDEELWLLDGVVLSHDHDYFASEEDAHYENIDRLMATAEAVETAYEAYIYNTRGDV